MNNCITEILSGAHHGKYERRALEGLLKWSDGIAKKVFYEMDWLRAGGLNVATLDDAKIAAFEAMRKAAESFDESRGESFKAYARKAVIYAVVDEIKEMELPVRGMKWFDDGAEFISIDTVVHGLDETIGDYLTEVNECHGRKIDMKDEKLRKKVLRALKKMDADDRRRVEWWLLTGDDVLEFEKNEVRMALSGKCLGGIRAGIAARSGAPAEQLGV